MPINSQNKLICSQSAWSLDADGDFLTDFIKEACSCGPLSMANPPDDGELQNSYTTAHSNFFDLSAQADPAAVPFACSWTGSWINSAEPFTTLGSPGHGAMYTRRHTMLSLYSFNQPSGMETPQVMGEWNKLMLDVSGANAGSTPSSLIGGFYAYYPLGTPQLYAGTALFESDRLANCNGIFDSVHPSPTQGLESQLKEFNYPFYNNYPSYAEDLRTKNQDYSIIPEFCISNWLQYYLEEANGDFLTINPAQFEITGLSGSQAKTWIAGKNNEAAHVAGSEIDNSSKDHFYKIFSNSDFMKHYKRLREDHRDFVDPTTVTLTCKGLLKLIPYDGFYPAERTLQIANLLSQSMGSNIEINIQYGSISAGGFSDVYMSSSVPGVPGLGNLRRPFYSMMTAPGLLFNSIKAGMAVDWPLAGTDGTYTGRAFNPVQYQIPHMLKVGLLTWEDDHTGSTSVFAMGTGSSPYLAGTTNDASHGFPYRAPFEALIEPEKYLKDIFIQDMEPQPDATYNYGLLPAGLEYPHATLHGLDPGETWPLTNPGQMWSRLANVWRGNTNNNLYKLAINNFLAEVPEFFLENESFSNLQSNIESDFLPVISGSTYSMRVKLRRSMDKPRVWTTYGLGEDGQAVIDFDIPQDPIVFNGPLRDLFMGSGSNRFNTKETFTLYSRPSAFGPPFAGTGSFGRGYHPGIPGSSVISGNGPYTGSLAFQSMSLAIGMRPSDSTTGYYLPHTPPYKDGEAWADITFVAPRTGQPTFKEIKENSMTTLWRVDAMTGVISSAVTGALGPSLFTQAGKDANGSDQVPFQGDVVANAIWNAHSAAYGYGNTHYPLDRQCVNSYAMQLDASINLFGLKDQRWTIEPKFETPHYNFNNIGSNIGFEQINKDVAPYFSGSYKMRDTNTLSIPTHGSESVPRGMWHQFGTLDKTRGIFLEAASIPESWAYGRGNNMKSNDGSTFNPDFRRVSQPYLDYASVARIVNQHSYNHEFNTTPHEVNSLAQIVGFEGQSVKLGNTAFAKTIGEAIVAVPFIEEDGERKFFEIPENVIRVALGDLGQTTAAAEAVSAAAASAQAAMDALEDLVIAEIVSKGDQTLAAATAAANASAATLTQTSGAVPKRTIIDMVHRMKKYIFPPRMDFVTFLGQIKPFAMYIFEFEYTLDQCELAKIWQNVLPDIGQRFVEREVSISHELLANELMGDFQGTNQESMKDRVQWMVFKVKKRANNNYFSKISKHNLETHKIAQYNYSYNWPYDYFSLVELAKVEAEVAFGTETEQNKDAVEFTQFGGAPILDGGVRATKPLLPPAGQARSQVNSLDKSERKDQKKEEEKEKREDLIQRGPFGGIKKK